MHWCCADIEEDPMRTLALTFLTMGIVLAAENARAQTYDPAFPVCMQVVYPLGATYQDCTYSTMAQCAASASGRGLQCSPNPFYAGPTASPRRNGRRYRQLGSISPAPAETRSYTPPGPPIHYRAANEPYYGASQGYAPGGKQRFLDSVRRGAM